MKHMVVGGLSIEGWTGKQLQTGGLKPICKLPEILNSTFYWKVLLIDWFYSIIGTGIVPPNVENTAYPWNSQGMIWELM